LFIDCLAGLTIFLAFYWLLKTDAKERPEDDSGHNTCTDHFLPAVSFHHSLVADKDVNAVGSLSTSLPCNDAHEMLIEWLSLLARPS